MEKYEVLNKKVISLDAETNGLWGQAFAIGAILYGENGEELDRFVGRCPIEGAVNPFVRDNVLPAMVNIPITHDYYEALLEMFFAWRASHRQTNNKPVELVHMGVPVEAQLYRDAHKFGIIGDWDGPYPLVDISAIPEIWDSPEGYLQGHGVSVDSASYAGGTHNPLFDSAVAYKAYRHWLQRP